MDAEDRVGERLETSLDLEALPAEFTPLIWSLSPGPQVVPNGLCVREQAEMADIVARSGEAGLIGPAGLVCGSLDVCPGSGAEAALLKLRVGRRQLAARAMAAFVS